MLLLLQLVSNVLEQTAAQEELNEIQLLGSELRKRLKASGGHSRETHTSLTSTGSSLWRFAADLGAAMGRDGEEHLGLEHHRQGHVQRS